MKLVVVHLMHLIQVKWSLKWKWKLVDIYFLGFPIRPASESAPGPSVPHLLHLHDYGAVAGEVPRGLKPPAQGDNISVPVEIVTRHHHSALAMDRLGLISAHLNTLFVFKHNKVQIERFFLVLCCQKLKFSS